jgi:hypothetical protein
MGWWLESPSASDVLLHESPDDLEQGLARRESQSAAEGFAELILGDRAAGLLDFSLV